MAKIKTALITTVLNEENGISVFLDSVFAQTQLPDEVIIVDGGSKDGTVSSIKYQVLSIKKTKVRLFIKKGNRSIGRNEAIRVSKSEIIAITDAGCVLDRNWFKNIVKPFEDPDVDVVAGYYKGFAVTVFQKSLIPYALVMPDRVDPKNFLPATRSMAFKKSVWKRAGGFDARLSNNEDYAFARKLKQMGVKMVFVRKAVVAWLPRKNIKQAFIMFYRFALGDIEAGIVRPKVVLVFFRYLLALYLLLFTINYLLLTIFFLAYLIWSILKNYKYVNNPQALFYLPLIQLTADTAVLLGSTVGFVKKIVR